MSHHLHCYKEVPASVPPVAPEGVVGAAGNGVCTAVLYTTIGSAALPDCLKSKDFFAV